MLSTNTLLRDGRYRIGHAISSGQLGAIYTAEDQTTKQHVAVIVSTVSQADANDDRVEDLTGLQHDGLMRVSESFHENSYAYKVTEPIKELEIFSETEAAPNETETANLFERLTSILQALGTLRVRFPKLRFIEIMPENVIETADGKLKLLFVEMPGILFARNPPDSPYLPFERAWNDLDLISQRAFYRGFDDAALEMLESPPDERSDIYSLGAVFYKLLTGHSPLTSFERSFEMLTTKKDPLQPPLSRNLAISAEQSQFVMKMLELKREDRFSSFAEAISQMPGMSNPSEMHSSSQPAAEIDDLGLLLEIPAQPSHDHVPSVPNGHKATSPVLDELLALSSMEVTPESAKYSEDLNSFVDQFYSQDRLQERLEEHFSVKETDEETQYSVTETALKNSHAETTPSFSLEAEEPTGNASFVKMIGLAVAGIVVVGAGGFGILSFMSSDKPEKSDDRTTYQAPAAASLPEPQPQPAQPTADSQPADQSVTTPAEEPQVAETKTETPPGVVKSRPQTAELKSPKPTDPKPAPKAEAKPKKKMTVDDLLN